MKTSRLAPPPDLQKAVGVVGRVAMLTGRTLEDVDRILGSSATCVAAVHGAAEIAASTGLLLQNGLLVSGFTPVRLSRRGGAADCGPLRMCDGVPGPRLARGRNTLVNEHSP